MKPTIALTALFTVAILGTAVIGHGQQAPAGNALDKGAIAALDKMGVYMRTLKAFQVQATTSTEQVLENGQKVSTGGTVDLLIERPNRMRAEISTDDRHRMFFYDGRNFSMWARLVNYYATVPAPASLGELVDTLSNKYDIDVPLTDLFYWGTDKSKPDALKTAIDVGPSQVLGTSCEHYAFRQDGLDWELWLQAGDFPLPRKLVLTTTDDEARPQYTSIMTWNLAPSFNQEAFVFDPPPEAHKIVLAEVKR
jgi:hypothetical protein